MRIANVMFISLFVSMIFEFLRRRDIKKVFADLQVFFDGMGIQFAAVVTLVLGRSRGNLCSRVKISGSH